MSKTTKKWDRYSIVAEVKRQGLTLTGIALDAGLPAGACRHGIIGSSRKGAEAIAAAIGVPFRDLFPDSYSRGRHGEERERRSRKGKRGSQHNTTAAA